GGYSAGVARENQPERVREAEQRPCRAFSAWGTEGRAFCTSHASMGIRSEKVLRVREPMEEEWRLEVAIRSPSSSLERQGFASVAPQLPGAAQAHHAEKEQRQEGLSGCRSDAPAVRTRHGSRWRSRADHTERQRRIAS